MIGRVAGAVRRASPYSITIFFTPACSASVGGVMVRSGNRFALARRDAIVAAASRDKISTDFRAGRWLRAALRDAAANF